MSHNLDSEYWRMCSARWEKITVPLYSAGNWTSFALHLRGNTEAFMLAASKHKKLRIHSGTHFHAFYSEEGRMDQLRWFDYWLKGIDTGIMAEPPVKLEIRTGGGKGPDGKDVFEVGSQGQPVPLTKGWLRASHRKLDPERSLPYRPYHVHDERWWLKPGEPVECQVEIWPTSIVLGKGHRLRLDIQPRDGVGSAPYTHYQADYNLGAENTIYAGGDKASYLLLPVIPPKKS